MKFYIITYVIFIMVLITSNFSLAQNQHSISPDSINVTPGVPVASGLGHFTDPMNHYGLTFGIQAGLGATSRSETFGYDNLTVSSRWTPGDNLIGRRISILAGFSDWQIPAFNKVFPDSVLNVLSNQERFVAQTSNVASLGMSITLIGGRMPHPKLSFSNETHDKLQKLDEAEDADNISEPKMEEIRQKRRNLLADERKKLMREFTLSVGILTRLTGFAQESDVQAYNLFASMAKGKGIVDGVLVFHYLRYLNKNELPHSSFSGSGGLYIELSDSAPSPILGISISYGKYWYRELYQVITEASKNEFKPSANRLDFVLSLSGAPNHANQPASGIGFKYSRIAPNLLNSRDVFSIIFATNFKFLTQ